MSKTGLKRNTIDKFYTKSEIVSLCINDIKNTIEIKKDDLILEPSAGNGSFISEIQNLSDNCLFYDIKPENEKIVKQDFLEYNSEEIVKKYNKIHVIGNPPFGRQSSLAIKFIKKSCSFCNTLSFILPKSFKKESLRKHFPLNFHLIFEKDLPENSFLNDEVEIDVPCVFQIWAKKDTNRSIEEKLEPKNFTFVKKENNPDIAFRRVGVNAGKIYTDFQSKSIESHYFIKFSDDNPMEEILDKLSKISFDFNNTVGPKSISKQEIISKINPLFDLD